MTADETKTVEQVTRALTGQLYAGQRVRTKSKREATVLKLRPCPTGGSWVRVKFAVSGGHWEYHSAELDLI